MRRRFTFLAVVVLAAIGWPPSPGQAQGVQTATLSGTIVTPDGATLPDTVVTLRSPALLGVRTARTNAHGAYVARGLAPGTYVVTFEHPALAAITRGAALPPGNTILDLVMQPAARRESVEVTATADSVPQPSLGSQIFNVSRIDKLAMPRAPIDIAEMSSGVTNNTPNPGQLTISGGFAYETELLVDGVAVSDNVLGTFNPLYIEDAIQEVQVLTSGIPAEYGHFGGGVVNTITKSGGNELSGSLRLDLSNPDWRASTPFAADPTAPTYSSMDRFQSDGRHGLLPTVQGTFGGAAVRDRLWFFAAARRFADTERQAVEGAGFDFDQKTAETRYLARVTGAIDSRQALQLSYTRNDTRVIGAGVQPNLYPSDPRVLDDYRLPQSLFAARYSAGLGSDVFVEAQYSQKKQSQEGLGGTSPALRDSPYLFDPVFIANAPLFDERDPEERNNRQVTASLSSLLSSRTLGTHDLKVGVEHYQTLRRGGGSQSSTGYVFGRYYVNSIESDLYDGERRLTPIFDAGSYVREWLPTAGAELRIGTTTAYVSDQWRLRRRWFGTIGLRAEHVGSNATGAPRRIDTWRVVPRMRLAYDLRGDGRWRIEATVSRYSGKYNDLQFGSNADVLRPNYRMGFYEGPPGKGWNYAPGFDLANYGQFVDAVRPKPIFSEGLSSPLSQEWTVGVAHGFTRGSASALYVHRRLRQFVEDFVDLSNGLVPIGFYEGGVDLEPQAVLRNSDQPMRVYDAVQIDGDLQISRPLRISASYTLQARNDGDFEGEAPGAAGLSSDLGNYPEFRVPRNNPMGRLPSFQRHKVRASAIYSVEMASRQRLDLGLLYRYDSPRTYSLVAVGVPLSDAQRARDPGYPRVPLLQTLYFGPRGSESFAAEHLLDLAVTYTRPLRGRTNAYVKTEIRNVLNAHPLIRAETTLYANQVIRPDADGLPLEYSRIENYGQARSDADYPVPRTFLLSTGVRF